MKFESKEQEKPTFEGKGIETVRRDQCPLTQKIVRNSLITLFQHGPTTVRAYLCRQWSMILAGKLPVSDFIITGRVRSQYRNNSPGPVQAALAKRLRESDPGFVMLHDQRLPFVIIAAPGSSDRKKSVFPLKDCVMTPMELLEQAEAVRAAVSVGKGVWTTTHQKRSTSCIVVPPTVHHKHSLLYPPQSQ
jgi:DNA polymerase zeta